MKGQAVNKKLLKDMPLDIRAEMALKEAVADAIAEHKKQGHPIAVWRDGKTILIPPEEIDLSKTNG
ncbi:MAG: hypothetical protein NT010_14395 [Proteobacteria bacterium]|nr:hypothetical protein [Pseudomonadota bacterium]